LLPNFQFKLVREDAFSLAAIAKREYKADVSMLAAVFTGWLLTVFTIICAFTEPRPMKKLNTIPTNSAAGTA
jgi:hypothetical protein